MSVSCEGTARANPSPKFRALQWPYAAFGRQCGNRQVKRSLLRTYPQLQQVSAPRPPVSESTTQWMAFRGRWQTLGIVWSQGTNSQMPRKAIHCVRSEEHTSELQSRRDLVCRLLLEKKKNQSQD